MSRNLALRCNDPDLDMLLELAALEELGLIECEVGDDGSVRCSPTAAAQAAIADDEVTR